MVSWFSSLAAAKEYSPTAFASICSGFRASFVVAQNQVLIRLANLLRNNLVRFICFESRSSQDCVLDGQSGKVTQALRGYSGGLLVPGGAEAVYVQNACSSCSSCITQAEGP